MSHVPEHILEHPCPSLWRCTACLWEWSYRPHTVCPGLPRYGPGRPTPGHLKTKTDLKKAGKKPGGPARGVVYQQASAVYHDLYDEREATTTPRRKLSSAQLAALAAGRAERERRMRCSHCGDRLTTKEQRHPAPGSSERLCTGCRRWAEYEDRRQRAARWARDLVDSGDFVVVDFETTGLIEPDIVEAAVVGPSGEVLFRSYLKPAVPVTAEARAVHGIPDEVLDAAPDLAEVHGQLLGLLTGEATERPPEYPPERPSRRVIAYNADFDEGAWRASCNRRGLSPDSARRPVLWDDAMYAYADFTGVLLPLAVASAEVFVEAAVKAWANAGADAGADAGASTWAGVWTEARADHTALDDARATLALLYDMAASEITRLKGVNSWKLPTRASEPS